MNGGAELIFARQGSRTVLAASCLDAPMAIVRPFEWSDGRLVVQLISLGPGLCGGDTVHIEVQATEGARVVVLTTAASRIMSMSAGEHAAQHVTLRAQEGSSLESYPSVTIPVPGAALTQTVEVDAAATARVGLVETWALGRIARGEYLQFTSVSSRTTVTVDGELRYADATQLNPATADLTGAGILAGHRYLANGVWFGATLGPEPPNQAAADGDVLLAFGQSHPGCVYLRALAREGPAVSRVVRAATDRIASGWQLDSLSLDRFTC
jgi:urease accessory protein